MLSQAVLDFVERFRKVAHRYKWWLADGNRIRTRIGQDCCCPMVVLYAAENNLEQLPGDIYRPSYCDLLPTLSTGDVAQIISAADNRPIDSLEHHELRTSLLAAAFGI